MTIERAILRFLDDLQGLDMHGFLLTLHGQTLCEGYWKPFSSDAPHRMYSVSKSCVSLAIGLLVGDGKLSLDERIVDRFPEWSAGASDELLEVTVRDMLMMATCYDGTQYRVLEDENWTRPFFFGQPTHPAGTLFHYDTSSSQTLGALVERIAGCDILSFLQERLFTPLGMTGEKRWLKDASGASQGGTGLLMTLGDLSKLANFCMSDGLGLIPTGYLREATACQIATGERPEPEARYGYGYQFWRMRRGFWLYGMGGQMALCLPDSGVCLCTIADLTLDGPGVQPVVDAFFRHLEHIGELAHDESDARALRERLETLRCEPLTLAATRSAAAAPCESDTARRDPRAPHACQGDRPSGDAPVRIALTHGRLPFDALTLAKDAVIFSIGGKEYPLPFASGQWKDGIFPATAEKCMTSGGWRTPDRFELLCKLNGDFALTMRLFVAFKDTRASVRVVSSLNEVAAGWDGLASGAEAEHATDETAAASGGKQAVEIRAKQRGGAREIARSQQG